MIFTGARPFKGRRDGRLVHDLPAVRRVVPHLMPTRLDATVYYPQHMEVERLTSWLEEVNRDRPPEERIRFFHVFLTALARLFHQRPELNRFVSGKRTYEHREISFSFTVKKALTDEADEVQALITFTGLETVDEVRVKVDASLDRARNHTRNESDKLVSTLVRLPGPVVAGIARAAWMLDSINMLPRVLQDAIPTYASAYLVNMGSLQAEAPFHHLYRHGTAGVFVAIGTISPEAVVDESGAIVARRRVDVVYTIDERVTDGFYLVRSAQLLQRMIDDPEALNSAL
ncbi:2-oxo acid dehydrogenase subunit E2 [Tessaracoccus sp. G1721]